MGLAHSHLNLDNLFCCCRCPPYPSEGFIFPKTLVVQRLHGGLCNRLAGDRVIPLFCTARLLRFYPCSDFIVVYPPQKCCFNRISPNRGIPTPGTSVQPYSAPIQAPAYSLSSQVQPTYSVPQPYTTPTSEFRMRCAALWAMGPMNVSTSSVHFLARPFFFHGPVFGSVHESHL
ncbi:hypothetical protein M427DRAFT_437740 [Gonapodya prolifera JEL478]|uniref:Uncharacterized protein n=1 Tax=Gonapodya prolifera (strain JEL478) TaxID=1344416 RepID=A0A139A504_GONPJ|nr:hypothetical protein M427DRAFT_437740 [Gonapodya prolifera JEL478]|eukprot:KXS11473.1 hypothetical protein M427DRAFT_437740 [Gonapodya prolifera JEL478]